MEHRYRFNFANYSVDVANSEDIEIEHTKDDGVVYFRDSLNTPILITRDCCEDYDLVWANLTNAENADCQNFFFQIQEGVGDDWFEIFRGEYSYLNFEVDRDRGTIEISIQPLDDHNCYLRNHKTKHDIFNDDLVQNTFLVNTDGYSFDCIIESYNGVNSDPNDFPLVGWGIADSTFEQWYNNQQQDEDPDGELFVLYCRLRSNTAISVDSYPEAGAYYTPYNTTISTRVITLSENSLIEDSVFIGTYTTGPSFDQFSYNFYANSEGEEFTTTVSTNGWVNAYDILQFLTGKLDCNLTASSKILNDNYNYVTGQWENPLKRLYFNQNSNIINGGDIDATILEISLDQFNRALDILFQIKYMVTGSVLEVEHISHFDQTSGLFDLTTYKEGIFSENMNKYKYRSSKLVHKEKWQVADQDRDELIYTDNCPNDEIKEHTNTEIYTNISLLVENQGANYAGICIGIEKDGAIGGSSTLLSNLIPQYYRHERPFDTGTLNGNTQVNAITITPNIEQTPLEFNISKISDFNPEMAIKTGLGTGQQTKTSVALRNKLVKTTIVHQNV